MIVFVLSSMLGMGLGLRVSEIVAPLRNWRLVMLSLVAHFVVMPFAALAPARLVRLDESMGIGLLLLGLAGGAPFLPKLAQIILVAWLPFNLTLTIFDWVELIGHLPFYGAMAFLLVWTPEERDLWINGLRNISIRRAGNALTSSPS